MKLCEIFLNKTTSSKFILIRHIKLYMILIMHIADYFQIIYCELVSFKIYHYFIVRLNLTRVDIWKFTEDALRRYACVLVNSTTTVEKIILLFWLCACLNFMSVVYFIWFKLMNS